MKVKLFILVCVLFSHSFVNAQSITSFSPSAGNAGEMINVTITGQNTLFQQGTDIIRLTGGSAVISPQQSTFVNDSLIQSVFAFNKDNPTGYYTLTVQKYNAYNLTLNNCFYLNPDQTIASVVSIAPTVAQQSDTITMTIGGLNTNFGSPGAPTTVWLKQGTQQISGSNITVINATTVQAKFIFTYVHPTGIYDLYFYNVLDGTVTGAGAFTLNTGPLVPALVSVQPNSAMQGELLTVSITGQNTNFQQGTDIIKLSNGQASISPQQSTVVNNTLINSTFAFTVNHPTGFYNLYVQKSGSYSLSLNNCFYLNPSATTPSLVSVTPSSATQNTTVTLTIAGLNTHFGHAGTTTIVRLKKGGYQITPASTSFIDSLTIQAQFTLSTSYPTGVYDVSVNNTIDGTLALPGSFTINAGPGSPLITSVSPNMGLLGETLTVSISGQNTNFQQGTNNVTLSQGSTNIYPNSLSFVSNTLINAAFTFSALLPVGYYDVNVTGSNPVTLTNGFQLFAPICSAMFTVLPDTVPHHYFLINSAAGVPPLKYFWSWGDGATDTVAFPSHTYSASGTYNICLDITDSAGCTDNYCFSSYLQKSPNEMVSVTVIPAGTVGLNVYEQEDQLKVFPNPATTALTIETPRQSAITITNIQGQIIKTLATSGIKTSVDISGFAKGLYFLRVQNNEGVAVKRFVKE